MGGWPDERRGGAPLPPGRVTLRIADAVLFHRTSCNRTDHRSDAFLLPALLRGSHKRRLYRGRNPRMLPPPEGGVLRCNGLKSCSEQSSAESPRPKAGSSARLVDRSSPFGHTQSHQTAFHVRSAKAKPRAMRVERRRDPNFPPGDFGQAAGQSMLKPSHEGQGFNPPSK
jgi:hypothetical protein